MGFFKNLSEYRMYEFMSHVKSSVKERFETGVPISFEKYSGMRLNSYERRFIQPLLDDNALIRQIKYSMAQEGICQLGQYTIPKSYLEEVTGVLLPEIIKRFESKNEARETDKSIETTHYVD
jgi:hypothetical protein